jgi:hypothetical protein
MVGSSILVVAHEPKIGHLQVFLPLYSRIHGQPFAKAEIFMQLENSVALDASLFEAQMRKNSLDRLSASTLLL